MTTRGRWILFLLVLVAGCRANARDQRDKYFASAQEFVKQGKAAEAVIQFRNAIAQDSSFAPAYLGLAKVLQQTNDHQGAVAAYRKVLALDGSNVEAKLGLGPYLLAAAAKQKELYRTVQQYAEEVLAARPSSVEARILLGNAQAGLGDLDKAAAEIEKALSGDPTNLEGLLNLGALQVRRREMGKAEETFKRAIETHPDSIQACLVLAAFCFADKRSSDAERWFKRAFDLDPAEPRALYGLAGFYGAQKMPDEQEKVFREAVARKPKAREPRWGLANYLLQKGRAEDGVKELQTLLADHAGDRPASLRLAEAYFAQKNLEAAAGIARSLLERNPEDAEGHYVQARCAMIRGELDPALGELEKAIRSKDSLLPAYVDKSTILLRKGDFDGAQSALGEALRRDASFVPARAAHAKLLAFRQRYDEALREAQVVLATMPANEDALRARAEALGGLAKLKEAREAWQELAKLRPNEAFYRHRVGLVDLALGDQAGAVANFRQALALRPDFLPAVNDLLFVHVRDKKLDEALAELDRLSAALPRDEVELHRGRLYLLQGRTADAERELRKAVETNPKNWGAYVALAQLNVKLDKLPQAIREVDQAIAKNPKLAPAYLLKGSYQIAAKETAGAMASFRKVLELAPDNPVAQNNLAWLLAESSESGGKLTEALDLARAARKRLPESPEVADTLGWIYYKQKNYVLAIDQLRVSVTNRRANASQYYRLGMAYRGNRDYALARQNLRKALELDPSFPEADETRRILKAEF